MSGNSIASDGNSPHLIETATHLQERGIGIKSLTEQVRTATVGGKLIFHIFASSVEFEPDVIRERTQAGLAASRARGRHGSHPNAAALNTTNKVALPQRLYDDEADSIEDMCRMLHVSCAMLHPYIKRRVSGIVKVTGSLDWLRPS